MLLKKIVSKILSKGREQHFFWIYHLAFKVTRGALRNKKALLWARNSFYFKNLTPGISDIDLTLLLTQGASAKRPLILFKILKFFFPILGEINVYRKEDLPLFKASGNFFELGRDPHLTPYLHRTWTKEQIHFDAIVFILRSLWNDYDYLESFLEHRKKKWSLIFKHIEEKLGIELNKKDLSVKSIIQNLILIEPSRKEEFRQLDSFLKDKKNKAFSRLYLVFYPNFWLEDYWRSLNFKEEISLLQNADKTKKEIVKHQISWEILGIYSQIYLIKDNPSLQHHWDNLQFILKSLHGDQESLSKDLLVAREKTSQYLQDDYTDQ